MTTSARVNPWLWRAGPFSMCALVVVALGSAQSSHAQGPPAGQAGEPPVTTAADAPTDDDDLGDDGNADDQLADGQLADDVEVDADEELDDEEPDRLTFAGSAQLDYLAIPTADSPRDLSLDGFTTELSLKVTASINERVTVQTKACFACHGFELGATHVDLRPWDPLRIRVGKFVPDFGNFPGRHDPANHLTSDKPLPYDMGRMVRLREWNMSVLPAPYVDNGVEARLKHRMGSSTDVTYTAFALGGLRGGNEAVDVDFIQSRSGDLYYVDNNSEPAVGGRVAFGSLLTPDVFISAGSSVMWGHYDPARELDYLLLGGDLVLRLYSLTLRAEYLLRRTRMTLGARPEERFAYGPGADGKFDPHSLKEGFYVELDFPLFSESFRLVGRFDGMRRIGNVLRDTPLRSESAILRSTLGANYAFAESFQVKVSAELYDFSDFDDEVATHLGLVGAF